MCLARGVAHQPQISPQQRSWPSTKIKGGLWWRGSRGGQPLTLSHIQKLPHSYKVQYSATAHGRPTYYMVLCGLSDFGLPCSVWKHTYSFGATRGWSGEYQAYSLEAHALHVLLIQVLYGRGKALLQQGKTQQMMRRLCRWTPEGLRYHVNLVEIL